MRKNLLLLALLTVVIAFGCDGTTPTSSAPRTEADGNESVGQISVVDLGTLAGGNYSQGIAINGRGAVAGGSEVWIDFALARVRPNIPSFLRAGGRASAQRIGGLRAAPLLDVAAALDSTGGGGGGGGGPTGGVFFHAALWAPDGSVTDLGVLAGGSYSSAAAINSAGDAVGVGDSPSGYSALLFRKGTVRDLGTLPGAYFTQAQGINDRGDIVGIVFTQDYHQRAVIWRRGGQIKELGTLPGGSNSTAFAINAEGDVAGSADDASFMSHAVLWHEGKMIVLDGPGVDSSSASALNDEGVVVGNQIPSGRFYATAFRWTRKTGMVDLGALADGSSLYWATGVNDEGDIIGGGVAGGLYSNGLLVSRWSATSLPTLGGGYAAAYSINDSRQIAGLSWTPDDLTHAVRWTVRDR